MQRVVHQVDAAELEIDPAAQPFVVVARNVEDLGALARLAQDFLDYVVVALRPIPAFAQAPTVDDVADEIEVVGIGVPQEIEKEFGLAAART